MGAAPTGLNKALYDAAQSNGLPILYETPGKELIQHDITKEILGVWAWRDGKPVAQLGPAPKRKRQPLPVDDPLLNLDAFAVDGKGGDLTNEEIDRTLYGGA